MRHTKMKLTSRSFAEFTAPGNLFNYDKDTRKWTHVASGVMTLNYVLSLKQSMDLVFAGTSHKKSRHDRREHIDRQYEISHRSHLRQLERSPGSWAFKAIRVDDEVATSKDGAPMEESAVIAVNFDVPIDSEKFCAHFEALQKQLTFQHSEHVKRGGSHTYSRKIRTIREFLNAIDDADASTKLMNQPVLNIHERVGAIFRQLKIGEGNALISKATLLETLRKFGFVISEDEIEMLCNIFMLYNENEGGASPDGRGNNGPDRGSYIHTDEFMMIFPASLMIHRSSRVQGEVTSAELNEQVSLLQSKTKALQNQVLSMSQMVGTFMGETSLSSFEASLDRLFNGDGDQDVGHYVKIDPNHHIASQLRARFQKKVVVYCSDMSGFSRISKAEGILHFLALVKMMQNICLPIIQQNGGELVKIVGDNIFATFTSASLAVDAAIMCRRFTNGYSDGKAKNDSIKLSIGLDYGPAWLLPAVDIFGKAAAHSFVLAENIASGEILVTPDFNDKLRQERDPTLLKPVDEEVEVVGVMYKPLRVQEPQKPVKKKYTLPQTFGFNLVVHPAINSTEPTFFSRRMAERLLCPPQERSNVDNLIDNNFRKAMTVSIMTIFGVEEYEHHVGVFHYCYSVLTMKKRLGELVKQYGGACIQSIDKKIFGQLYCVFESPAAAVEVAILAHRCVASDWRMDFDLATGIAYGEILDLDGYDAFGNAVNTAFKLGEDHAQAHELLVDRDTMKLANQERPHKFRKIPQEQRTCVISSVEFPHVSLDWRAGTKHAKNHGKKQTHSHAGGGGGGGAAKPDGH